MDLRVLRVLRKLRGSRVLLAIGLVLGLPHVAAADWMVSGFFGQVWTRPSTVHLDLPEQHTELELVDLHYRSDSFKAPPYYGYRISWLPRARPSIAIEGEFIHAKVFTETDRTAGVHGTLQGMSIDTSLPVSTIAQRLAMSHGLNLILANVVVRRSWETSPGRPRVAAAFRAGAGPTLPHAESTIFGVDREQYEAGGLAAQLGGGLEVALGRGFHFLGEYKFTWTTAHVDVAGGSAEIPARSHHLVGGLGYRF